MSVCRWAVQKVSWIAGKISLHILMHFLSLSKPNMHKKSHQVIVKDGGWLVEQTKREESISTDFYYIPPPNNYKTFYGCHFFVHFHVYLLLYSMHAYHAQFGLCFLLFSLWCWGCCIGDRNLYMFSMNSHVFVRKNVTSSRKIGLLPKHLKLRFSD